MYKATEIASEPICNENNDGDNECVFICNKNNDGDNECVTSYVTKITTEITSVSYVTKITTEITSV